MPPVLRPYQHTLADACRAAYREGHRAPLVVSPTGSGKTVLFSYIAANAAARQTRLAILCHRAELLEQISAALRSFQVQHGIIAPGYITDRAPLVQVASVQTIVRRLDQHEPFGLLVIDEAHHAIEGSTWGRVIAAYPQARVLGVTATPERLGGQGLSGTFDTMIEGPTTAQLIADGYLSPYRLFAPAGIDTKGVHTAAGDYKRDELERAADKPTITGDAVAHYLRIARGKRAIAFCVSVRHAQHVAEQFQAAGIPARAVDGGMERHERKGALAAFTAGTTPVLCSCDLVSEGLDVPGIEVAILLRPTQSLALYLQQVGRALRTAPGKREALILDHASNALRHGLPDDEREWSLEGRTARKRKAGADDAPSVKVCAKCFCAVRSMHPVCPHCGFVFPVQSREVAQVAGELQEVDPEVLRRARKREEGAADTLEALQALGAARGYAPGWAAHRWRARQAKQQRRGA